MTGSAGGARLVAVLSAPRTPPGQLTWPAWQALRSGPVLVADEAHPHVAVVRAAGVDVQVADPGSVAGRLAAGRDVVWLALTTDRQLLAALDRGAPDGLELVHGSSDPPGSQLLDVVAVMDRLRSPGGCPWDAGQTHRSLARHLIEEAYEAYQALEDDDPVALREELGDVLLQVVFHARLATEASPAWTIDDVAGDLVDKLVRRHPHVFAGASADDLEGSWEAQKAAEKGRTSVTDGVPISQPALLLAATLQKRADRLGAPVPSYDGPGGQLWEQVRHCRAAGLDPEVELRGVARAYRDRLAAVERAARLDGEDPADLGPERWQTRWAAQP